MTARRGRPRPSCDYAPIVLEDVEEVAVQVIAELVGVLGTEGPERSV